MARSDDLSPQLLLDYLIELGTALMSAGCPTHRLEELLVTIAKHEGHSADVFALPTGLFVSLRTPNGEPSRLAMIRVQEWTNDLEKLTELDELLNEVVENTIDIAAARVRIAEVQKQPPVWSARWKLLAAVASSAGAAVVLGGDVFDAALAGAGGLVLRLLMLMLGQSERMRVLENFAGGVVAAIAAGIATRVWPGHSREVLVLAIIIQLLPGLTLTVGLSELTYRNLVAGTARVMHAAVTLLSLVFGIAVVVSFEKSVAETPVLIAARDTAPFALQLLSLLFASFGFGVMMGLPRRRLIIAFASSALVFAVTLITRPLPTAHAVFLDALVLGVGGNLFARVTSRPAQLFHMPGMLLLVPGALSFRSLDSLLAGDAVLGINGLADVILVAVALVMGLLVANVVLPSRKAL
jgi:uncharacterized membrane protein YjjP (DUF1212 family)